MRALLAGGACLVMRWQLARNTQWPCFTPSWMSAMAAGPCGTGYAAAAAGGQRQPAGRRRTAAGVQVHSDVRCCGRHREARQASGRVGGRVGRCAGVSAVWAPTWPCPRATLCSLSVMLHSPASLLRAWPGSCSARQGPVRCCQPMRCTPPPPLPLPGSAAPPPPSPPTYKHTLGRHAPRPAHAFQPKFSTHS